MQLFRKIDSSWLIDGISPQGNWLRCTPKVRTVVGSINRREQSSILCDGAVKRVISFWKMVGSTLSQIIGVRIPVNPRLMLLLDLDFYKLQSCKVYIVNLLTAATLLMANGWKLEELPTLEEWTSKVRHMCLRSKLNALFRYRARYEEALLNFTCQWAVFVNSSSKYDGMFVNNCVFNRLDLCCFCCCSHWQGYLSRNIVWVFFL